MCFKICADWQGEIGMYVTRYDESALTKRGRRVGKQAQGQVGVFLSGGEGGNDGKEKVEESKDREVVGCQYVYGSRCYGLSVFNTTHLACSCCNLLVRVLRGEKRGGQVDPAYCPEANPRPLFSSLRSAFPPTLLGSVIKCKDRGYSGTADVLES